MAKKLRIIQGVASGIRHLHSNRIVHRDIAARTFTYVAWNLSNRFSHSASYPANGDAGNILLTSEWDSKVSDFGMSRIITEADQSGKTTSATGPLRWVCHETLTLLAGPKRTRTTDSAAFAICRWPLRVSRTKNTRLLQMCGRLVYSVMKSLQSKNHMRTSMFSTREYGFAINI